jgi:hypothetical protein
VGGTKTLNFFKAKSLVTDFWFPGNLASKATPAGITNVMPAQAGIQKLAGDNLDSRFRGNDTITCTNP